MPRAPKVCRHAGCTTLTTTGTCPQHTTHRWGKHQGRKVPHWLQRATFRRDNWTCQSCGHTATPGSGQLHADHIQPRSRGGTDTLDNMRTLCKACHAPKSRAEARGSNT
ncbi:hypothetical protein FLORINDA_117 [Mycobacterium phage Florinda]|uniref:HNH nuclease domain-containing protein n=1 Tax=Mycobacterium phage Florinda TaxID=1675549 RepID=A0A0K1LRC5_9CAUD|nr:HNH endonuclease [Mycobacterium phage Florinda]AKU45087.1 hypothetical protein FLORINDA_117 [Mycobacterium phage Florinda]